MSICFFKEFMKIQANGKRIIRHTSAIVRCPRIRALPRNCIIF
jgi:hypothetical protein